MSKEPFVGEKLNKKQHKALVDNPRGIFGGWGPIDVTLHYGSIVIRCGDKSYRIHASAYGDKFDLEVSPGKDRDLISNALVDTQDRHIQMLRQRF